MPANQRSIAPFLLTLLLWALPVVLSPVPVEAADIELTPMASYRADQYELRQELGCVAIYARCTLSVDGEEGPAFGLILGLGLTPHWQLELIANRQESEIEAQVDLVAPPGTRIPDVRITEDLDFEVTHVQVGVSRSWGEGPARPFVGAAAGASRVELAPRPFPFPTFEAPPVFIEERSEDALSASLGAGIKVDLSPRVGLRLEARGYWVDLTEDAGGAFTQADAVAGLILRF